MQSTRDPPWMTPLAEALLKKKAKAKCRSPRVDAQLILKKELTLFAIATENRKSHAIFMICILLLSVTFVMYFNGRNKDIY